MADSFDVVMLVLNDVVHDGRVRREASALAAAGWRVLVVGTQRATGTLPASECVDGYTIRRVRFGRWGASQHLPWRWLRHGLQSFQILRHLASLDTRALHAHDLPALMLSSLLQLTVKRQAALVYDAHELFAFQPAYPSAWSTTINRIKRPVMMATEHLLARRADPVLTVSEPLARVLARRLGVPRPTVVRNAIDPVTNSAMPTPDLRAHVPGCTHLLVHTGDITNRGRMITELVQAMTQLPDKVGLILLGQGEDEAAICAQIADQLLTNRVKIIPPVPVAQVAATITCADAAVVALRPDSANIWAALPNKLFEAVAAGLPVVASDTFGVRRIVRQYGLGLLYDPCDPRALVQALTDVLLPDNQRTFREHVARAQHELNWHAEASKLVSLYRDILP